MRVSLYTLILVWALGGVASAAPVVFPAEYAADAHTVALYHFNGDYLDSSGNGRHLTVQNPSGLIGFDSSLTSSMGSALATFGSTSDWSNQTRIFSSQLRYPGSGSWTVESLAYFPESSSGTYLVQHYSEHVAGHDPYRLGYFASGASWRTYNGTFYGPYGIPLEMGEWHHLAGVYDAAIGQNILYIDGLEIARTAAPQPETLNSYNVYLAGSWFGVGGPLLMDEVRISNIARSSFGASPGHAVPLPSAAASAIALLGLFLAVKRSKVRASRRAME